MKSLIRSCFRRQRSVLVFKFSMKILLFIDNPSQDSLYTFWAKALRKLGHEVIYFEQMPVLYAQPWLAKSNILRKICQWGLREKHLWGIRQIWPIKIAAPLIIGAQNKMNKKFIETARTLKPQLIIVLKGLGIYPKTLLNIKLVTDSVIVNFNGDDPHNLFSSNQNVIDSLAVYDHVFTWSKMLVKRLTDDGATRVHYLPFAADADVYKGCENPTAEERKMYGSDIVFVGTGDPERKSELESLSDLDLGIWGPYWDRNCKKSHLMARLRGGRIDVNTMAKVYRSSKVVLNLMREQNFSSHNMKTFEIPSIGAFMLAPRTSEHADFFEEGKDIACYGSAHELREKAIYFIAHDAERAAMAKSAHEKTLRYHTYIQRMTELLRLIALEQPPRA